MNIITQIEHRRSIEEQKSPFASTRISRLNYMNTSCDNLEDLRHNGIPIVCEIKDGNASQQKSKK